MSVFETIDRVKALAQAEQDGDPVAHRKVIEAVHKLQLQLESPFDTALRVRFQPIQNIAVRIAIEYGILQSIAKQEGQDVSAASLAAEAGADEVITERLVRMICWMGYCDEMGENLYRANATTMHVCTPGLLGGEKHHTEILHAIGGEIVKMMRAQGGQFYSNPPPGLKDPMEWTHGHRFFDFMRVNEEHRKYFNDYMSARREGYQLQWFDIFPIHERIQNKDADGDGVLVCDVGGGHGHELVKFLERFSTAKGRLILEDLGSTFEGLSLPAGIEAIPHDFFQPQPEKARGARFYYMRQIMHDWSDSECRTILGHLVRAMDPAHSRLLIDDYVMPPTNAEFRAIHMDVCMMMYLRSEERTERRWQNLLESAGLEIVKIWTPETGFESIIETKVNGKS